MKTNLKKAVLPFAVMVFGVAAAFTTNAVKHNEKDLMDVYRYDISKPEGQRCVKIIDIDCVVGPGVVCTDIGGNQVWGSPVEDNGSLSCTTFLSKP